MRTTGRAAVWYGNETIRIKEYTVSKPDDNGMVLKTDAAAICGTDGHLFPQSAKNSAILGHEVTGTIISMGKNANQSMNVFGGPLSVGDRVVLYPWITCGKCGGCLTFGNGTCTICESSFVYGIPYDKLDLDGTENIPLDAEVSPYFKGGFGEYLYIYPETYLWKLPKDMPSEVAVLLDPLAVAVRSIELALTCPGVVEESFTTSATVTIIGDGPVGAFAALVARMMGVEKIIVIGGRYPRLSIIKNFADVDYTINYKESTDVERIEVIKTLTGGKGSDVVIQCSNSPTSFVEGLNMIRRAGTLVEVGNMVNTGIPVAIDPASQICAKHARIFGMSANSPKAFDKAFHILKRHDKIDFMKLYTHRATLETLGDTLKCMKNDDYFKGIVTFN